MAETEEIPEGMKRCSKCGEVKTVTNEYFAKRKDSAPVRTSETMMRIATLATLTLSLSALGQIAKPTGVAQNKAEPTKEWGAQEVVLIGGIKKLSGGRVRQSLPPTFSYQLEVKVGEILRGTLTKQAIPGRVNDLIVRGGPDGALPPAPPKVELTDKNESAEKEKVSILRLGYYVMQKPELPTDEDLCIIALEKRGSSYRLKFWEVLQEKTIADVRLACSLPMGWKARRGKVLSPWAELEVKWPEKIEPEEGQFLCASTGRPILDWNPKATMTVAKIPSAYPTNFNPDGDGEMRLKISNFTTEPVTIPVLRRLGKRILWKESLVILVQDRAFRLPGSKGIGVVTQPVTLAPNEEISTTVNPLTIREADWPETRVARIIFRFCLGTHQVKDYFTYYKEHHDDIRRKLLAGQPLRPLFLGD
jgi:hypothetical protein